MTKGPVRLSVSLLHRAPQIQLIKSPLPPSVAIYDAECAPCTPPVLNPYNIFLSAMGEKGLVPEYSTMALHDHELCVPLFCSCNRCSASISPLVSSLSHLLSVALCIALACVSRAACSFLSLVPVILSYLLHLRNQCCCSPRLCLPSTSPCFSISRQGYHMIRATRGCSVGTYYFEVTVNLSQRGHTRIGWSTEKVCPSEVEWLFLLVRFS